MVLRVVRQWYSSNFGPAAKRKYHEPGSWFKRCHGIAACQLQLEGQSRWKKENRVDCPGSATGNSGSSGQGRRSPTAIEHELFRTRPRADKGHPGATSDNRATEQEDRATN